MTEDASRPAWSQQFATNAIRELVAQGPIAEITPDWAWGGSDGQGVRVGIIDSGVEWDHPAVGDAVRGGVAVEFDEHAENYVRIELDEKPQDVSGHGTACAGIIHGIAPQAEIYSIRVLGRDMRGRAVQFAHGINWAIENGMHVANLSLSTSRQEYYAMFHELADEAYFHNVMLISAVNNVPTASYPSLYSSVISVAAHEGHDPFTYYYNPSPPVEFGAPGIDVHVAWNEKQYIVCTGNSFAAPHIAGMVALIQAKHPGLTPFQIKTVLWACAANTHHEQNVP